MPNYKIEGNIDFYGSLYSSLDYDSDDQGSEEKNHICEISGQALTNNHVTLECKHRFNYNALYTEICKQKFDFQSYTSDVLSKTDFQKVRDSKLDYYIKCPYCRHIQFELLPYHEELGFQKKYGVNTCDTDFRVIKTSYVPSTVPSNYTYMLYGYKFVKGACCKPTLVNGKTVSCWNSFITPIIAPDGSTKLFCPIHVRSEVKAFKIEIKKKEIEETEKQSTTSEQLPITTDETIIADFDKYLTNKPGFFEISNFAEFILQINKNEPTREFSEVYYNQLFGFVEKAKELRMQRTDQNQVGV